MKHIGVFLIAAHFCGILSGCNRDSQADAVQNVVQYMNDAAAATGGITEEVQKALQKHEKDKTPLDFTAAVKAATALEQVGKKVQELKVQKIEQLSAGDEDTKADLAKHFKDSINSAFQHLLEEKKKLDDVLQKAERVNREKTEELRAKIRQAEGPFDTLNRQG